MMMEELRVSDQFLIEAVFPKNKTDNSFYSLAYIATEEEGNYFKSVMDHMNFFILIYTLVSGQSVTFKTGIGTQLHILSSLGKKRVAFADFEKIEVIGTTKDDFLTKPILETKELFLKFLPSRKKIMESQMGLALIYYYIAVQASQRRY